MSLCGGPRRGEGRGTHQIVRDDTQPDPAGVARTAMRNAVRSVSRRVIRPPFGLIRRGAEDSTSGASVCRLHHAYFNERESEQSYRVARKQDSTRGGKQDPIPAPKTTVSLQTKYIKVIPLENSREPAYITVHQWVFQPDGKDGSLICVGDGEHYITSRTTSARTTSAGSARRSRTPAPRGCICRRTAPTSIRSNS